ncbi:MAG: hypothetical protein AAGG69_01675, partial [Pseudomonadota bacterium]
VDTELYRDIAHNPRIPLNDYWSDVFLAMESAMICPCPLATYRGTIQCRINRAFRPSTRAFLNYLQDAQDGLIGISMRIREIEHRLRAAG